MSPTQAQGCYYYCRQLVAVEVAAVFVEELVVDMFVDSGEDASLAVVPVFAFVDYIDFVEEDPVFLVAVAFAVVYVVDIVE
jgi:hypothetical protein